MAQKTLEGIHRKQHSKHKTPVHKFSWNHSSPALEMPGNLCPPVSILEMEFAQEHILFNGPGCLSNLWIQVVMPPASYDSNFNSATFRNT